MIISNAEHLFCRRKAILLVRHCCYGLTCVGAIGFKALLSWLIITVLDIASTDSDIAIT